MLKWKTVLIICFLALVVLILMLRNDSVVLTFGPGCLFFLGCALYLGVYCKKHPRIQV